MTLVLIAVAVAAGYVAGALHRRSYIRAAALEGRVQALQEAKKLAQEYASFEMADTPGRAGQRLERAQIAYDLSRELGVRVQVLRGMNRL